MRQAYSNGLEMLSSPLVQIRVDESRESYILTHTPIAENDADLFSWKTPASSKTDQLLNTLFFVRFTPSTSASTNKADQCHLSLGLSPNSFLCVNTETGIPGLTSDISIASVFNISRMSSWDPQTPPSYTVSVVSDDGIANKGTLILNKRSRRAVFVNLDAASMTAPATNEPVQASVSFQFIPISTPINGSENREINSIFMRLYNVGKGTFAVSKPDCAMGAGIAADQGWDMFRLDRHPNETGGRLFDPRLSPLKVTAIGRRQPILGLTSGMFLCEPNANDEFLKVEINRLDEKSVSRANAVILSTSSGYFSMEAVTSRSRDITLIPKKNSVNEEWRLYLALPSEVELHLPRITLTALNKGIRRICSDFQVVTSLDLAYKAFTDYNEYSNILTDCTECEIIEEHSPTDQTIRIIQASTFLKLTISTVSTLGVKKYPSKHRVDLSFIKGTGVKHYKASWAVVPIMEDNYARKYPGMQQCRITSVIEAATTIPAPGFLLENLINSSSQRLMGEMKAEIEKRGRSV